MTEQEQDSAEQPSEASSGILRALVLLWSYKWFIVIPTAAAAVGTVLFAVVSLLLPPDKSPLPNYYRSEAAILMNSSGISGSSVMSSVFSTFGLSESLGFGGGSFDYGRLAMEILRSPVILDQLAQEFEISQRYAVEESVRSRSREILLEKSSFSLTQDTGILRISFEDIDPEFAQNLTSRTVTLLNEWFRNSGSAAQTRQLEFLQEKLAEVSQEIGSLEAEVQEFQREHGAIAVQDVSEAQERMLADLRTQLVLKEMEIKNYRQFSTIEDPTLARLRSERNNLRAVIGEIERGETSVYGDVGEGVRNVADLSQQYAALTTQLRIQRSLYESLLEQYELARIAQERSALFQVIQPAEVPDQKSGPRRSKIVIQNTLIVLVLSVLGVLVYHRAQGILSQLKGRTEEGAE